MDIYVANDTVRNFLYRNDGHGRFVDVAYGVGVGFDQNGKPQAGMGVDCADVDGNGFPDLVVTNFSEELDTLYMNDGHGAFEDATVRAGLGSSFLPLGFGAKFGYSVGGPVGKAGKQNKLFFFYAHEYRPTNAAVNGGNPIRVRVPTARERAGDFSQTLDNNGALFNLIRDSSTGLTCSATNTAGCFQDGGVVGKIPLNRIYGPGLALLSRYPLPNITQAASTAWNYEVAPPSVENLLQQPAVRLDYQFSQKLRVMWKYQGEFARSIVAPGSGLPGFTDVLTPNTAIPNFATTVNYSMSPTTFLEATYGYIRNELTGGNEGGVLVNESANRLKSMPDFPLLYPEAGVVDAVVNGAPTDTMRRVLLRECGSESDSPCAQNIEREVNMLAFYYENQVTQEVNGLTDMMRTVGTRSGRKTVVLVSAGMPAADRPGARPNMSDLAKVLGEEAARANATIYTLFLDSTLSQAYAAETRKADQHPVFQARESEVLSRFLDQFASTSGGALMHVVVGAGENALGQILRETSAYYLLGVEPAESDRDGQTHKLRVRVDAKGATVRSRTWVHVPARQAR